MSESYCHDFSEPLFIRGKKTERPKQPEGVSTLVGVFQEPERQKPATQSRQSLDTPMKKDPRGRSEETRTPLRGSSKSSKQRRWRQDSVD